MGDMLLAEALVCLCHFVSDLLVIVQCQFMLSTQILTLVT